MSAVRRDNSQAGGPEAVIAGTQPFALLTGTTGPGVGLVVDLGGGYRAFGLQVSLTGAPAAAAIVLEGSLDGQGWAALCTWSLAGGQASGDIVWAVDKPASLVRAHLTGLSGGTAPTVSATAIAA